MYGTPRNSSPPVTNPTNVPFCGLCDRLICGRTKWRTATPASQKAVAFNNVDLPYILPDDEDFQPRIIIYIQIRQSKGYLGAGVQNENYSRYGRGPISGQDAPLRRCSTNRGLRKSPRAFRSWRCRGGSEDLRGFKAVFFERNHAMFVILATHLFAIQRLPIPTSLRSWFCRSIVPSRKRFWTSARGLRETAHWSRKAQFD